MIVLHAFIAMLFPVKMIHALNLSTLLRSKVYMTRLSLVIMYHVPIIEVLKLHNIYHLSLINYSNYITHFSKTECGPGGPCSVVFS